MVHALPLLQGFVLNVCVHAPLLELHESFVHGLLSSHLVLGPGLQVPAPLHLSPIVQALPSSQAVVPSELRVTHCDASTGLHVSNVQLFTDTGQGLTSASQLPCPSHSPAHAGTLPLGRQATPLGAGA